MSQYQVPQDVEAEDKLLGPFTFRQFVYLLIAAAMVGVAVILFRIFPVLAIIPVPIILLFAALALPLKKDQPMETYLAAIVSFYLKPRNRLWRPGQPDTNILITAPKQREANRARNISRGEASRRLSFLADIVDSEGYAIKGANVSLQEDVIEEANQTKDMFDSIDPIKPAYNDDDFTPVRSGAVGAFEKFNRITNRAIGPDQAFKPTFNLSPSTSDTDKKSTIHNNPFVSTPAQFTPPSLPKNDSSDDFNSSNKRSIFSEESDSINVRHPEPIVQPKETTNANSVNPDIIETDQIEQDSPSEQSEKTKDDQEDNEVYISLH